MNLTRCYYETGFSGSVIGNRWTSIVPILRSNEDQGYVVNASGTWNNPPFWYPWNAFTGISDITGTGNRGGWCGAQTLQQNNGQWLSIAFPETTYVERVGINYIRTDGIPLLGPWESFLVLIDGNPTLNITLPSGYASYIGNLGYVFTFSVKMQVSSVMFIPTVLYGGATRLPYVHDIIFE